MHRISIFYLCSCWSARPRPASASACTVAYRLGRMPDVARVSSLYEHEVGWTENIEAGLKYASVWIGPLMLIMKENRDEHAYQSSCTCARTSHFDVKVRTQWPFAYTYTLWAYDVYITSMLQCSVVVCLLIRAARSSFCFISFFSLFHLVSVGRGFFKFFYFQFSVFF
jgi:hypothetical protein